MAIDLKYGDRFTYTSYQELAKVATEREIRKEYTRLRDIAQKRVKRLGESEFSKGKAYQRNKGGFLTLAQMTKEGSLSRSVFSNEIKKLVNFLSANTSTVSGSRQAQEKAISSLRKYGYDFIDQSNIHDFGEFMEAFRAEYGRNARGSQDAAELYETLEQKGIDPQQVQGEFWFWLENRKEIDHINFNDSDDKESRADYVRQQLGYFS